MLNKNPQERPNTFEILEICSKNIHKINSSVSSLSSHMESEIISPDENSSF